MEPIEYLKIFRRRWATILVVCLLGGVAAWVATPAHKGGSTPAFQATATLILSSNAPSGTPSLPLSALLVTTGDIPARAAKVLNFTGDPQVLAAKVTAKSDPTVNDLQITSVRASGAEAATLANTFADQLIASLSDRANAAYQQQVTAVQKQLDDDNSQIAAADNQLGGKAGDPVLLAKRDSLVNQYRLAYDQFQQLAAQGQPQPAFSIIQRAVAVPASQSSFRAPSSRLARLGIGLFAGLILGAGLILLLERIDLRIRTKEQAEEAYGYPVVAEIPVLPRRKRRLKQQVTLGRPGAPFAEAHRILRTLLLFSRPPPASNGNGNGHTPIDLEPQVILVISASPSEGKTTTVAQMAVAYAEIGRTVLVLSCDFHRPRVHQMFGLPEAPGITDVLSTDGLELADVVQHSAVRGISLIHSGSYVANAAELIAAAPEFINQSRELADIVLVDTAPILVANDASEVMAEADAVLLVARAGRSTRGAAQRASDLLGRVGVAVVGVVLTAAPEAPTNRHYYYYRYYLRQEGVLGWRRILRRTRRRPPLPEPTRVEPKGTLGGAGQTASSGTASEVHPRPDGSGGSVRRVKRTGPRSSNRVPAKAPPPAEPGDEVAAVAVPKAPRKAK